MTFDKAYNFVKQKRSRIYPNFGFRQQLQMFEKLLFQNGFNISNIYFRSIKWKPSEHSNNYFSFIRIFKNIVIYKFIKIMS